MNSIRRSVRNAARLFPLVAFVFLLACDGTGSAEGIGPGCTSEEPGKLCLALKYVVYRDTDSNPIVNELEAISNISTINKLWNQCGIAFQIDEFLSVSPRDYGLSFQTAHTHELGDVRRAFVNDRTLLIVTTGSWDRTGSLGNTGANAWTSMPGGPPYGAVLEESVRTYANIIAHELGHYLNLYHVSDAASLMNPIIYRTSTKISESDCKKARSAAKRYWARMLR